jgi:hypothetical protein
MVETAGMSGRIVAINSEKRKVTLENPDGKKRAVKVEPGVDLPAWPSATRSTRFWLSPSRSKYQVVNTGLVLNADHDKARRLHHRSS